MLLGFGGVEPHSNGVEAQAGAGVVDDEHGNAAPLPLFGVRNRLHQDVVGRGRARDEHFGAIQHPIVAVEDAGGLHHPAGVRPGLGFGLTEGVVQVALNRRQQVFALLFRRAGADHLSV